MQIWPISMSLGWGLSPRIVTAVRIDSRTDSGSPRKSANSASPTNTSCPRFSTCSGSIRAARRVADKTSPRRASRVGGPFDVDLLDARGSTAAPGSSSASASSHRPERDERDGGVTKEADTEPCRQTVAHGVVGCLQGRRGGVGVLRAVQVAARQHRARERDARTIAAVGRDVASPTERRQAFFDPACIDEVAGQEDQGCRLDLPVADRTRYPKRLFADCRRFGPRLKPGQAFGKPREHLGSRGGRGLGRHEANGFAISGKGDREVERVEIHRVFAQSLVEESRSRGFDRLIDQSDRRADMRERT